MSNVFNDQILTEKLSKLNNSQQSIETLSHWCIFHRKKAKQVVETWEKLFNGSQKEKRVSFLYLANDILQNSRRKGSEYVNEFWKVLPGALKDVSDNGDDHGKSAVSRLVDIWEERKVFGSRGRSLKDEMLGKDPPPLLETNGRSSQSHSIKIVKKDAHSVRIKLAIGGMPEKIVTAFQSVHEEHPNEDSALSKCKAAVRRVGKMEKDVDNACARGDQQGSTLANELQEQETILRQCIEQLESMEATRVALVTQLKEALQEQESKLEHVRTQLQVGQAQIEQASAMRQRLVSGPTTGSPSTATPSETIPLPPPHIHQSGNQPPPQPLTSFADSKNSAEDQHKKAAAAMAAKLAASTSSAQMLSSVLSSLAAEEAAASMTPGVKSASFTPIFPVEKRPKLEKPMPVSDANNTYFVHLQQPPLATFPPMPNQTSSANQPHAPFPPPPPAPPPPVQQYVVGMVPYGYNSNGLPPPPPLPSHISMGLPRPSPPQQQQQQQQQQPVSAGYYQSPVIGFYGPTTPPVPRQ